MLLSVAIGGAVGTVLRYLLSAAIPRADGAFPTATLLVNVTGSLVLGALVGYLPHSSLAPATRVALTVGLCGGFTTFSAFSLETIELLQGGQARRALLYIGASLVLSLAAIATGLGASRALLHPR